MSQAQSNGKVMIMAGGTGGHIFPGLAVARALKNSGVDVVWLGSEGGMEVKLVSAQGFSIEAIAIKGLRGKGLMSLIKAPVTIARAIAKAQALMRRYNPEVVVSFGGYTAGPGGIAAYLQGRCLIVHEQNCAPGLTNRMLSRIAKKVLTGFPNSFAHIAHTTVGNPVREEISALPAPEIRLQQAHCSLRILVLGGSQGAKTINALMPKVFAGMNSQYQFEVRHQSGESLLNETLAAYQQLNVKAQVEPFIQDMAAAYAWADIVIGRAGALTVSELCAAGVASILIPLPTAVDDHQAKNADFLKLHGGGIWFRQDQQLQEQITIALADFAQHPERVLTMAKAARAAAFPNAAKDVAAIIVKEMVR
jgi:UDP-N-acetylglucosamine--N-acetylmuramyl-(pentapeptide) pyrophosphoryl-undecaprenol N-acetylglucosamine transferase